jgi:hypothetical protein
MIGAHLYLVAKLGTTAPPWLKAEPEAELTKTRSDVNQQEKEKYLREYAILKSQGSRSSPTPSPRTPSWR